MPALDLLFPVIGSRLPTDHGYALYGALARIVPALHEPGEHVLLSTVQGQYVGEGLMQLAPRRSFFRVRAPVESIPQLLVLAGKGLDIDGHRIRLGVPQVRPLIPAAALIARLVTIKTKERATDPAAFLAAARRQLDELGVRGEAGIPLVTQGPHTGQPRRHVLRIKDRRMVGYSLQVTGLTAEESIRLQEHGLGGRKRMGCGFFVPLRPR